ncbi:alanyl-tRNA editing protein [Vibrio rhodolitus]|uniref:alanyl-tRNA editing protein n=1 Tax=Vibrio rhodolitus TaxID=2231649 RepID=UPI000E0B5596|nr:alanyl-tRNA editing protein [Vibrio rhodolitus]
MTVTPTITQFCHQTWQLTAQIQLSQTSGDVVYIVTDKTPFHPVSHVWPDHPADRGTLALNGSEYPLIDCLVGAVELASNTLYVDKAIPVKRDEAGWAFVVVHVVENTNAVFSTGDSLVLSVDKHYQQALSRGHSAGHLAFLALNKVLTDQGYWRKDADRKDTLGSYDFNNYAQETSFVTADKCLDSYRLGKTLRKRGLNSADVSEQLQSIENNVNQMVSDWLAQKGDVVMHCEGEALTDSRYWRCDLGDGKIAEIPCGGTHVNSLKEYASIKVSLRETSPNYIEMQTDVIAASA